MSTLEEATQRLEIQLETLKQARTAYKLKSALKKHLENMLIRNAEGKSQAEKSMNAYASEEWKVYSYNLARLEDIYEHESLKFEVLKYDYQTRYLLRKEEEEVIKRY